MNASSQKHWDRVYASSEVEQLGWYEAEPTVSLEMIENCAFPRDTAILDVGSGATTLIDVLLQRGYTNLTALDLSNVALEKLRSRLGETQATQVNWQVADITDPAQTADLGGFSLWHDRAMLHFLTAEAARQAYHRTLERALQPGGFAIIAAFAKEGADKCSGLDVQRYDAESLASFLSPAFKMLDSRPYTYQMPSGALRPYVYARFRKEK